MPFLQGPVEDTLDDRNRVVRRRRGKVARVNPGGDVLLAESGDRQASTDRRDKALQITLVLVECGRFSVLAAPIQVDVTELSDGRYFIRGRLVGHDLVVALPSGFFVLAQRVLSTPDGDVPAVGELAEKGLGLSHGLPPVDETDESEGSHGGSPPARGGLLFVQQTVQSSAGVVVSLVGATGFEPATSASRI